MKIKKSIKDRNGTISSIILLIAIAVFITSVIGKYKLMVVMSNSMYPTLKKGEIIVSKSFSGKEELSVGDICTYIVKGEAYTITHRIVDITDEGYIFRGDNNKDPDKRIVTKDQIISKVIY